MKNNQCSNKKSVLPKFLGCDGVRELEINSDACIDNNFRWLAKQAFDSIIEDSKKEKTIFGWFRDGFFGSVWVQDDNGRRDIGIIKPISKGEIQLGFIKL